MPLLAMALVYAQLLGSLKMKWYKRLAFELISYCSMLVGLTSARVDFEKTGLQTSIVLKLYALLQNILLLICTPHAQAPLYLGWKYYEGNPLVWATRRAHVLVFVALIVIIVVGRWNCESRVLQLVLNMLHMQRENCNMQQKPPVIRKLWYLFYAKVVIHIYHNVNTALTFKMTLHGGWWKLADGYHFNHAVAAINTLVWQHTAFLCCICECFHMLGVRLDHLFQRQKNQQCGDSIPVEDLSQLCDMHAELVQMMKQLNTIYQLPLLAMLGVYCAKNATAGYYFVVIANGDSMNLSRTTQLLFLSVYFLQFLDFYLGTLIYEETANIAQQVSDIMRQFSELRTISADVEQICDVFSMQILQNKVSVNIVGVFDFNRSTLLTIFAQIVSFTIVLVQHYYEVH